MILCHVCYWKLGARNRVPFIELEHDCGRDSFESEALFGLLPSAPQFLTVLTTHQTILTRMSFVRYDIFVDIFVVPVHTSDILEKVGSHFSGYS